MFTARPKIQHTYRRNAPQHAPCPQCGALGHRKDTLWRTVTFPPAEARDVYKGADPDSVVYVGNKEVGRFMRQRVFEPGRTMTWNELTRHATGADLSPEAFARDFKGN